MPNSAQALPAPHVRAAITAVTQPRKPAGAPPAAVQAKPAPSPVVPSPALAGHVRAAIAGGGLPGGVPPLQPKAWGAIQPSKKSTGKAFQKAEQCWKAFSKYNTEGAKSIGKRMVAYCDGSESKASSKILGLMVEWGYLGGYVGHGSSDSSSKKRGGTDDKTKEIRDKFDNWLSNHNV